MKPLLEVSDVCLSYHSISGETRVLSHISFSLFPGEFLAVVGPSGCGKSTTLRMIAGLEQPSAGSILLDGTSIDHLPPQKRDMAMIFQNYALYENMTAFENMAFPLKVRGVKKL